VTTFAAVSVLLAAAGHALGHGHVLDVASAVVAVVLAGGLGLLIAGRWTAPRLLLALAAVQVVVHGLGSAGVDPRLVAAAAHGHAHGAPTAAPGAGSATSMLLWHLVAVPVTALALEAVRRSAVVVVSLSRAWVLAVPVHLPSPPASPVPDLRPRTAPDRPHLLVARSNAPPCPA
jgi:hypothetical protein